ncbi:LOW QUALITY PROTEIN: dynein heavy chain 6, axonemal [Plakobranchus ocellatus]|uniref:Dynein heavy chain 6, axonemal n=1 Tax=Plakobranchus ocellatus TaxID=259542 RepID=A0AAV4C5C3_9GAST|nr:LOW QUALITY PROTEIN: dynein heavy chain 6, axonemal [Plakobranchus ocellatus]
MSAFGRNRRRLRSRLLTCDPLLSDMLLLVRTMCLDMSQLSLIQVDGELTYTISEFMEEQEHFTRDVTSKLERCNALLTHLTARTCWDDVISAGLAVEREGRRISAPKRISEMRKLQRLRQSAGAIVGHPRPQDDVSMGVWLASADSSGSFDFESQKNRHCDKLARFIYLTDLMLRDTVHQIYFRSLAKTSDYLHMQLSTFPTDQGIAKIVADYLGDIQIPEPWTLRNYGQGSDEDDDGDHDNDRGGGGGGSGGKRGNGGNDSQGKGGGFNGGNSGGAGGGGGGGRGRGETQGGEGRTFGGRDIVAGGGVDPRLTRSFYLGSDVETVSTDQRNGQMTEPIRREILQEPQHGRLQQSHMQPYVSFYLGSDVETVSTDQRNGQMTEPIRREILQEPQHGRLQQSHMQPYVLVFSSQQQQQQQQHRHNPTLHPSTIATLPSPLTNTVSLSAGLLPAHSLIPPENEAIFQNQGQAPDITERPTDILTPIRTTTTTPASAVETTGMSATDAWAISSVSAGGVDLSSTVQRSNPDTAAALSQLDTTTDTFGTTIISTSTMTSSEGGEDYYDYNDEDEAENWMRGDHSDIIFLDEAIQDLFLQRGEEEGSDMALIALVGDDRRVQAVQPFHGYEEGGDAGSDVGFADVDEDPETTVLDEYRSVPITSRGGTPSTLESVYHLAKSPFSASTLVPNDDWQSSTTLTITSDEILPSQDLSASSLRENVDMHAGKMANSKSAGILCSSQRTAPLRCKPMPWPSGEARTPNASDKTSGREKKAQSLVADPVDFSPRPSSSKAMFYTSEKDLQPKFETTTKPKRSQPKDIIRNINKSSETGKEKNVNENLTNIFDDGSINPASFLAAEDLFKDLKLSRIFYSLRDSVMESSVDDGSDHAGQDTLLEFPILDGNAWDPGNVERYMNIRSAASSSVDTDDESLAKAESSRASLNHNRNQNVICEMRFAKEMRISKIHKTPSGISTRIEETDAIEPLSGKYENIDTQNKCQDREHESHSVTTSTIQMGERESVHFNESFNCRHSLSQPNWITSLQDEESFFYRPVFLHLVQDVNESNDLSQKNCSKDKCELNKENALANGFANDEANDEAIEIQIDSDWKPANNDEDNYNIKNLLLPQKREACGIPIGPNYPKIDEVSPIEDGCESDSDGASNTKTIRFPIYSRIDSEKSKLGTGVRKDGGRRRKGVKAPDLSGLSQTTSECEQMKGLLEEALGQHVYQPPRIPKNDREMSSHINDESRHSAPGPSWALSDPGPLSDPAVHGRLQRVTPTRSPTHAHQDGSDCELSPPAGQLSSLLNQTLPEALERLSRLRQERRELEQLLSASATEIEGFQRDLARESEISRHSGSVLSSSSVTNVLRWKPEQSDSSSSSSSLASFKQGKAWLSENESMINFYNLSSVERLEDVDDASLVHENVGETSLVKVPHNGIGAQEKDLEALQTDEAIERASIDNEGDADDPGLRILSQNNRNGNSHPGSTDSMHLLATSHHMASYNLNNHRDDGGGGGSGGRNDDAAGRGSAGGASGSGGGGSGSGNVGTSRGGSSVLKKTPSELKPMFHAVLRLHIDAVVMSPDVYDVTATAFNMIHDMEEHVLGLNSMTASPVFLPFTRPTVAGQTTIDRVPSGPKLELIVRRDTWLTETKNAIYQSVDAMFLSTAVYIQEVQSLYDRLFRDLRAAPRYTGDVAFYCNQLARHDAQKLDYLQRVLESQPSTTDLLFRRLVMLDSLEACLDSILTTTGSEIAALYDVVDRFSVPYVAAERQSFESSHYLVSSVRESWQKSLKEREQIIQDIERLLDRDVTWLHTQVKKLLKPMVERPLFLDGKSDPEKVKVALTETEEVVRSHVTKANFVREVQQYLKQKFETLDIQKINSYTFKYMEACDKLEKVLPKNTVVTVFGEKVDIMLRWLNFIIEFRGHVIKPRHWRQMEEALGVEFGDNLPLTLASLMSVNAVEKQKVLHAILNKARAESNIQTEYDEVIRQCQELSIPVQERVKMLVDGEDSVTVFLMLDTFERRAVLDSFVCSRG